MKWTTEKALEQAYVLIAHLTDLRLDLQPHEQGPLTRRQQLALVNLFEVLQPLIPEDMQTLTGVLRGLAAKGLGFQPDTKNRGEIINLTELIDEAGLSQSPASLALIKSMQARCEEITGDKYIGALWGPGGESMRAVLTVGGIRVPIMPALKALDGLVKELAQARAEELIQERLTEHMDVVQDVLDHAATRLKEHFGDPDAEWSEAVAAASDEITFENPPPGHHKCLECDTIYNAVELEVCPKCQHPRPVWYNSSEEPQS